MHIKFIWPGAKYNTRTKLPLMALNGKQIGEMDNIPAIIIPKIANELRKHPCQEINEIHKALKMAAHLFENEIVDGESPLEYVQKAHMVSGIPISTIKAASKELSYVMNKSEEYVKRIVPNIVTIYSESVGEPKRGNYWIPKGRVLSVIAPGNNPLVHKAWIEALAAGYKILLRPSLKEPITPNRLIKSMLMAGIAQDMIAFIPGDHSIVNEMIESGDLALLFGGKNVVDKYKSNRKVIVRGPGYSKVFWDYDTDVENLPAMAAIVRSIADDGGMKCTNASGLILHDENIGSIEAIADELTKYTSNGLLDSQGTVPIFTVDAAVRIQEYISNMFQHNEPVWTSCNPEKLIIDYGDGTAGLSPLMFRVNRLKEAILEMELPFACSWVYVPEKQETQKILKNTLALNLMSKNEDLIKWVVSEPSIKKVVLGHNPTWMIQEFTPHDGFILEHLFLSKGVV